MALIESELKNAIREVNDGDYSDFVGWGDDLTGSAQKLAEAITKYCKDNFNPPTVILPSAYEPAEAAFVAVLETASIAAANGLIIFGQAVHAYQVVIASNIIFPAVGIPPVPLVMIADFQAIGLGGASSETMAGLLATRVHANFLLGQTLQPTLIPPVPPINWS